MKFLHTERYGVVVMLSVLEAGLLAMQNYEMRVNYYMTTTETVTVTTATMKSPVAQPLNQLFSQRRSTYQMIGVYMHAQYRSVRPRCVVVCACPTTCLQFCPSWKESAPINVHPYYH